MESNSSGGVFGRRGPPVKHQSIIRSLDVLSSLRSSCLTSEMINMNHSSIVGPQVPPGHRSNIHQEKRHEPPVKCHSIIRKLDILSSLRSEICRRMFGGGQHHPSAGSGSVGGSSFFHEAEQHESAVKLHRSSSNELLPPDNPDHQPVMRSRSFDWLPPVMPEPRPVHPAAIWEERRQTEEQLHPSGCGAA